MTKGLAVGAMNVQLVEELFNETIRHPPQDRTEIISVSSYAEEVKETVTRSRI